MTERKKHIPATKNVAELGKLPPQSIDIEEAVLGALLLESGQMHTVSLISPETFYKIEHQKIFQCILDIHRAGRKPDILTVAELLRKNGDLQTVGGPGYIARLTNKIASAANLDQHCKILKEKQMLRLMIEIGSELIKRGYDETSDVFETAAYAADEVASLLNFDMEKSLDNVQLGSMFMDSVYRSLETKGITGLPTGYKELDALTSGLQPCEFIVLAARPSMGKTALALCIFLHAVLKENKRFIFFTLEMSALELFKRLVSICLNIAAEKFRNGQISPGEIKYINENLEQLLSKNLIIVENCDTIYKIRTRIKKEKMNGPIHGVAVDYIQRAKSGKKTSSREQEVSEISMGLKDIAKDEAIPLIGIASLGRKVEDRKPPIPQMSDLRESGAIEYDADQVWLLYRANYYGLALPGKEHIATLIVEKNRNGSLQQIDLAYIHSQTKFVNPDEYISDNTVPY